MTVTFILRDFDDENLPKEEDFLTFLETLEQEVPDVLVPMTIMAEDIRRIRPSGIDPAWTDVFTIDGDILLADEHYSSMRTKWLTALYSKKPREKSKLNQDKKTKKYTISSNG